MVNTARLVKYLTIENQRNLKKVSVSSERKMAGFEDDKDDLFDTQRLSLLDVIEERNRALNKKSMINRMVVVGKLRPDMADKRDLGQHYEKVILN